MHFFQAVILAFVSLTPLATAIHYDFLDRRETQPYDRSAGIGTRYVYPETYYGDEGLYTRKAEPYYGDEGIYARQANPEPLANPYAYPKTAAPPKCERGEILSPRGNCFSAPVTTPSHCNDVFKPNGEDQEPKQIRIDCYNRIQCKGTTKTYVGLSPKMEEEECLAACRCP